MNDTPPPWSLLARYLANEATPAERRTVDAWIAATDANRAAFERVRHRWVRSATAPFSSSEAVWDRHIAPQLPVQPATSVRPLPVHRWWLGRTVWPLAAAIAGLLLFVGYKQFIPLPPAPQVAATSVGKKAMLTLPDGSRVWLNADSKLEYPEKFDGPLREVRLRGEAFFDVIYNAKQPFVIRLATASVRVLGTSFNVRAYPGDATVKTTVVTGKVAFVPNQPMTDSRQPKGKQRADTLFVLPNHHVTQTVRTLAATDESVMAQKETAWKDNKLVFDQTPMREVARTLERWYGLPVLLTDDIADCPLTATFAGQSLAEVMTLIGKTGQFDYELSTKNLTIGGLPCR